MQFTQTGKYEIKDSRKYLQRMNKSTSQFEINF